MTDWRGLERIADRAARRFPSLWRDDIRQEALLAAWQHEDNLALAAVAARRRAIDHARHLGGRHLGRQRRVLVEFDAARHSATVAEYEPLELPWVDERHRYIGRRLAVGDHKDEIAADLGVSPSRVSQLIAEMREAC